MDLRRSWPTIGLVVLLVLDLVLVVWAVWPTSGTPASGAARASGTSTASGSSPGSSSPTSSTSGGGPSGYSADAAAPRPLARLLVPVGPDAVWAADVGTCAEPGRLHVSDDRGRTWRTHPAPGSVTRIRADGASTAFVVGGIRTCLFRLWTTADGGVRWDGPRSAAAAWGRSPKDARVVQRPAGDPVRPCRGRSPVLDLVALGGSDATALCGDGALRRTTDGGAAWTTSGTREGAVALALSAPGAGAVAWLDDGCDGVVVGALTGGDARRGRCVGGVDPVPGEVALGVAPSGVWLAAGDSVLRAEEPGGRFQRVSDWPVD